MQIVPNSSSLYTLFYSVIYNSVPCTTSQNTFAQLAECPIFVVTNHYTLHIEHHTYTVGEKGELRKHPFLHHAASVFASDVIFKFLIFRIRIRTFEFCFLSPTDQKGPCWSSRRWIYWIIYIIHILTHLKKASKKCIFFRRKKRCIFQKPGLISF